ncbi:MAG: ATP-binding protein [Thainema sp.]
MEDGPIKLPETDLLAHLFAHGGEMGARIQAFDWTSTAIGSIDAWPQSLKVALQILLLSKFPMQILWGREYVQFYNDAYIAIAGDKHPTALGQRGQDCWQEVWHLVGPMLDRVVETGTATWSEDQLLMLDRYGQPEEGYFTFSYTPIWESPGTVGGIFIAVNETTEKIISERRERELRIETQAAKEVAERANQLKDQFLAVLSHELRSPLNPILGWSKLLLSRQFDEKTTQRALETIERNAKSQAQMIDDLLDISRILENKLILNMGPVPLIPIIKDAMSTVQTAAETKGIVIQIEANQTPAQVLGDATRLKQVFWNLLSNAVKFTPDGGRVEVRLEEVSGDMSRRAEAWESEEVGKSPSIRQSTNPSIRSSTYAQITVSDTGKGIAAEFLPYVFDRFQQGDSTTTKSFGGLGLGLAIAKQIVDLHGGTIEAASPGDGQGSTFTVQLPLVADLVPTPESDRIVAGDYALTNIHVFVIEDDDDSRELITFTLEMYGATVTTVSSATNALDALRQSDPDIVISDIGMPEMDGYMLMQAIRNDPQTRHIPAIALTSHVGQANQTRALAVGFQAHLPKPLEVNRLVKTILKLVKRR